MDAIKNGMLKPVLRTPGLTRVIRFGISGLLATGLHVGIALSLIDWCDTSQSLANSAACACATVWSYLANTLWSFSSSPDFRNAYRFTVVSFAGLLLTGLISGATQAAGAVPLVGIAAVVSIVPGLTFVAHRFWTYR